MWVFLRRSVNGIVWLKGRGLLLDVGWCVIWLCRRYIIGVLCIKSGFCFKFIYYYSFGV